MNSSRLNVFFSLLPEHSPYLSFYLISWPTTKSFFLFNMYSILYFINDTWISQKHSLNMKCYTIFFYVISYLKEVTINSFNFVYFLYIQIENWYLYLSYICVCVFTYALVSFLNRASLVAQLVKNQSGMQETLVRFLDWEDPLEKETATHSSILAWEIPWTV